jgi:tetratricopeptide (TPR) repeat protein
VGDVLEQRVLRAAGAPPAALAAVRAGSAELEAATGLWASGASAAARHAYAEAESLFAQAAELDPSWPEPRLRRAEATVKLAVLLLLPPATDRDAAHDEILRGLDLADEALARAGDRARALQVRGYLGYWAGQTADSPEAREAFYDEAERDLLAAVGQDPGLDRAWSTLSSLAERRADYAAAYHRARRAYLADYSLRAPVEIMARLFTNALEVGDVEGAARWCEETHRRRPGHWAGYYCDLRQMAWTGAADVARSDSLLREALERVGPAEVAANVGLRLQLVHAVVLARAGEAGEARAILASAEASAPMTPDLLDLQAWVRLTLGDRVGAQRLLAHASDLNPVAARPLVRSHRYASLASYTVAQREE